MSKRTTRDKPDRPTPADNAPSPIRGCVEAISAQCDRIRSAEQANDPVDRCRQWNAAVRDPQCKGEIQELFRRALAAIQLLPPDLLKQWSQRLSDLAHGHDELLRRADNFGVLAQQFVASGRPLLTALMTGRQAETPPEVEAAFREFEAQEEQHRKLIDALVVDLVVLEESSFRIRWDKKTRELWFRGALAKKFSQTAASNQEKLLDKFEEAQWERAIEDPFDMPKQLGDTLRELNKNVAHSGLAFRALGNGMVEWGEKKQPLP